MGEAEPGQDHQAGIQEQGDAAATDDPAHGADVAVAGAFEETVERLEQPATQQLVEEQRETVLGRVVFLEQHCRQGRGQGQGVEGRDHRGNGDGQGELLVELSGQATDEGRGHEYRAQHQGGGDDRAGHFAHGALGGFHRVQAQADVTFDVLHHHDGVVHHDADGQYQAEQRQRVEREAEQVHHREGADQRDRYRHQRDDRGAPGLQEQDHYQYHQHQGFEQGMHHCLDGATDEDGRVIDDAEVHAFGEVLLELGHLGPHFVGNLDGIGARTLEDRDRHRRLVVQQRAQGVLARPQLDPGDVFQAGDLAVFAGANDDVLELFLGDQAALGVDRQLETGGVGRRWRAQGTGSHLAVLFTDCGDHVGGGQVARSGLVRVQPHAQRVVAHAEQLHVAHAAQAR